jgi:hypothetical protein
MGYIRGASSAVDDNINMLRARTNRADSHQSPFAPQDGNPGSLAQLKSNNDSTGTHPFDFSHFVSSVL